MKERLLDVHDFWPAIDDAGSGEGIHLSVDAGQLYAAMGPDGNDISRWLKAFAGIEERSKGSLFLLGKDLDTFDKPSWQWLRTQVAYLDEETRLMSVHSLLENMLLPALYHKLEKRGPLSRRAKELFAMIDYGSPCDLNELPAYIDQFSCIKAMLVRALLLKPKFIIVDNYFKSLNRRESRALIDFLLTIAEKENISLLVHGCDLNDYVRHCDVMLFFMKKFVLQFEGYQALVESSQNDVEAFLRDSYIN